MINFIQQILINGSQQIYGGYIYNFDYQPSFGSNPSYVTINIISENGTYSISNEDLQIETPDTITIGANRTLQMYPVRFKFSQSAAGKVLEIKYIDTSLILDKKIVVLNGRQGSDGNEFPINPLGGAPTYVNDQFLGSCYIPLGKELLTVSSTYNDVLNVVYTFPMLIQGITINGITINADSINLIQNSNQYYYASYIGTLRNVLSQWCTDLGYGFYWENNSLHFIDLTVPLVLDTTILDGAVQDSNSTEVTIEDTIGRVACAFYGQDRQVLGSLPGQDTQVSFKCVTMSQVGLTQDQIYSIIAAFMGEDFFISYHLLLNSDYGNGVLGIKARTGYTDPAGSAKGKAVVPKSSDNQVIYNQYVYVAQDMGEYQTQWEFYKDLMTYVGKYYYLPINYGTAKLMSKWEFGNPEFFNQLLPCAQTPLGTFANILGAANQQLQQFLVGRPYLGPTDVVSVYQDTVTSNGGIPNPYDNTEGDLILDAGKPSWQISPNLDGNFVNVSAANILQFITDNNLNSYYAYWLNTVSNLDIVTILNSDNPPNYSQVISAGALQGSTVSNNVLKMYIMQRDIPGGVSFNLNGWIKTPEELYPDLLPNVFIANNAMNIQPKIEEFFRTEIDKSGNKVNCNTNVIKNELNFRQITRDDLTALGSLAAGFFGQQISIAGVSLVFPALPSPATLEEIFTYFSKNLTLSKSDPTIIKSYSLPYIDLPNNYTPLLGNGLMSLQIRMDEKGVNSTYTMGTRLMQVPSLEAIRQNLEFQRRTNESRFVPYGYQQVGTVTE